MKIQNGMNLLRFLRRGLFGKSVTSGNRIQKLNINIGSGGYLKGKSKTKGDLKVLAVSLLFVLYFLLIVLPFAHKYGFFIDSSNNVIVPFAYDYVSPFSNGLARVVIADDGNAILPYLYSAPEWVWLKGKCGFVDMSGNVIIPIIYDYAFPEFDEDGFVTVKLDGLTRTIDKAGKVIKQGANVKDDK